jgi:predicted aspartyl protease
MIIVQVAVNGAGPFEFLLDTGTNTTIIEPELAQQLSLRPQDRIELMTVAGAQAVPRAYLNRLALGSAAAENLETLIADLRPIRALHPGIRGLLGQNFLSQFNYLLDYHKRQIEFEVDGELADRICGARLPFEQMEGLMIVSAQSASLKTWRLVMDSASASLILFGKFGQSRDFEISHRGQALIAATASDSHKNVEQGRLRTLRIGETIFTALPVTLLPPDGRAEDGLLPMSLFRAVYVNHKERYVILNPSASIEATSSKKAVGPQTR